MKFLLFFLSATLLSVSCNMYDFFSSTKSAQGFKVIDHKDIIGEVDSTNNNPPAILLLDEEQLARFGLSLDDAIAQKRWEWLANPREDVSKSISDSGAYTTRTFNMVPEVRVTTEQITRVRYTHTEQQSGQTRSMDTMNFSAGNSGILDILMVLDSSGSMRDEQESVANNLPKILEHQGIGSSNWQLTVVNTEPNGNCSSGGNTCCKVFPTITKTTTNYQDTFTSDINSLSFATGTEYAAYNTIRSIEGTCNGNIPWPRDDLVSNIAIVFVTDEKHQCPNDNVCSINNFKTYLSSLRPEGYIKVYGLVSSSNSWGDLFEIKGNVAMTDANEYGQIFTDIATNLKSTLKSSFELNHLPDNSLMEVKVNGSLIASSNYKITNKLLMFNDGFLAESNNIEVKYSYDFIPFEYEFDLANVPLNERDKITVVANSNELTYGDDFNLRGSTISLTGCSESACSSFPSGSTLTVAYQQNVALKNTFEIDNAQNHNILTKTLQVEVGGSRVSSNQYTYDSVGKTISFVSTPPEGARIDISYSYLQQLSHSYALVDSGSTVVCKDGKDQNIELACSYNAGILTYDSNILDLLTGKSVMIWEEFSSDLSDEGLVVEIDENYLGSSVIVECKHSGGVSSTSAIRFVIDGNDIKLNQDDFTACADSAQAKSISSGQSVSYSYSIRYQTREDMQEHFLIAEEFFTKYEGKYKFIYIVVELDSDDSGNFVRIHKDSFSIDEDHRITMLNDVVLKDNSKVRATVYLFSGG